MGAATIDNLRTGLAETFAQMPEAVIIAILSGIAIAAGVAAHAAAVALVRRAVAERSPHLGSILSRIDGPARLALVLLALNFAVAGAPLDHDVGAILGNILQLAFIGFVGWTAIAATNIAADLYLQRFNIDVPDNLLARKQVTQVRVLKGALNTLIVVVTAAAAMMTFEQVCQYGESLFASAGIVVGLAARPMLSNLNAGVQLAVTQPIRLDDAVIVENEFGFVEEITATYVVVRLWGRRRMIVPLSHFIEKPFQNWTRQSSDLIGGVLLRADYTVPVEAVRERLNEIVESSPLWDGRVVALQVTDADSQAVELRALVSARTGAAAFDLRCLVREKLIEFLAREYPGALPHRRQETIGAGPAEPRPTARHAP